MIISRKKILHFLPALATLAIFCFVQKFTDHTPKTSRFLKQCGRSLDTCSIDDDCCDSLICDKKVLGMGSRCRPQLFSTKLKEPLKQVEFPGNHEKMKEPENSSDSKCLGWREDCSNLKCCMGLQCSLNPVTQRPMCSYTDDSSYTLSLKSNKGEKRSTAMTDLNPPQMTAPIHLERGAEANQVNPIASNNVDTMIQKDPMGNSQFNPPAQIEAPIHLEKGEENQNNPIASNNVDIMIQKDPMGNSQVNPPAQIEAPIHLEKGEENQNNPVVPNYSIQKDNEAQSKGEDAFDKYLSMAKKNNDNENVPLNISQQNPSPNMPSPPNQNSFDVTAAPPLRLNEQNHWQHEEEHSKNLFNDFMLKRKEEQEGKPQMINQYSSPHDAMLRRDEAMVQNQQPPRPDMPPLSENNANAETHYFSNHNLNENINPLPLQNQQVPGQNSLSHADNGEMYYSSNHNTNEHTNPLLPPMVNGASQNINSYENFMKQRSAAKLSDSMTSMHATSLMHVTNNDQFKQQQHAFEGNHYSIENANPLPPPLINDNGSTNENLMENDGTMFDAPMNVSPAAHDSNNDEFLRQQHGFGSNHNSNENASLLAPQSINDGPIPNNENFVEKKNEGKMFDAPVVHSNNDQFSQQQQAFDSDQNLSENTNSLHPPPINDGPNGENFMEKKNDGTMFDAPTNINPVMHENNDGQSSLRGSMQESKYEAASKGESVKILY